MSQTVRKPRADAVRNRALLLDVAYQTFVAEGADVPIDEIARRAGVGPGTVYRHFPTKDALYRAIVVDRLDRLTATAAELAARNDPHGALLEFLDAVMEQGAQDQLLGEALAGVGFDIDEECAGTESRFMAILTELLGSAQAAGSVRSDIDADDVKTLLVGVHAMRQYRPDPGAMRRLVAVVHDGLAPPVPER